MTDARPMLADKKSADQFTVISGILISVVYTQPRLPRQETNVMAKKKAASKKKAKKKAKKKR